MPFLTIFSYNEKAVKIHVEFYSFLYIIIDSRNNMKSRKELKEYGKYFTSI